MKILVSRLKVKEQKGRGQEVAAEVEAAEEGVEKVGRVVARVRSSEQCAVVTREMPLLNLLL